MSLILLLFNIALQKKGKKSNLYFIRLFYKLIKSGTFKSIIGSRDE